MPSNLKAWFKKIFARDVKITRKGIIYFLVAFVFFIIAFDYVLMSFILEVPLKLDNPKTIVSIITLVLTIVFAGLIVDSFLNRMNLLLISAGITLIGFFFFAFSGTVLELVGYSIIIFSIGVFFLDLLTILTHETTILNRGRILGYLFFTSLLISHAIVILSLGNKIIILVIETTLFFILLNIRKRYNYIETKERLKSEKRLRELTSKHPIMGYLGSFMVLGFILGNAFPISSDLEIEPVSFFISICAFMVITGLFLDNMGRKWSFTAGVLIISALIIFADIVQEGLYNSFFFGISLSVIFILLFTFSGDFSTERNTLKYRGRITGTFLLYVVGGFVGGYVLKYFTNQLYLSNTIYFYWIPALIGGVNSFLLIVLLVWMMPLPEIFSAKEADWARSLKNIYIFNKDSICLFAKNFLPDEDIIDLPPEDLITGGLTGILTLISEITNERQKNLRIIDKDRVKIYFAYGRNVIVALISTKYLPILFKKLEIFTKAFERKFEEDLNNFRGKINVFLNKTDSLISRYFK